VTIPPPEPPVRRRPVPRRQALRGALARASLRVRVMAAAAVLVAVTSVLMGLLGTVLLRGYLVGRVDAQLRTFSSFISRVASRPPSPPRRGPSQLPTDFLVEVIDADGQVHVVPESRHGIAPPVVPAARLHGPDTPFTAPAADGSGHSWRVVVRAVPGGRQVVTAVSLDNVQSTVGQLETADAVAGAAAIVLLACIGFPLVRASLAPLSRIEDTRRPSPRASCPGASPHRPNAPRWAGLPPRSTPCWAGSRPPTGPGRTANRGHATPRTGCAGSSPTPATSCGPR
jgi:hypothetical protein